MSGYAVTIVTLIRPGYPDENLQLEMATDVPVTDPGLKKEIIDAFNESLGVALDPARYNLSRVGSLDQPKFTLALT